jgi:hypothetical protein
MRIGSIHGRWSDQGIPTEDKRIAGVDGKGL